MHKIITGLLTLSTVILAAAVFAFGYYDLDRSNSVLLEAKALLLETYSDSKAKFWNVFSEKQTSDREVSAKVEVVTEIDTGLTSIRVSTIALYGISKCPSTPTPGAIEVFRSDIVYANCDGTFYEISNLLQSPVVTQLSFRVNPGLAELFVFAGQRGGQDVTSASILDLLKLWDGRYAVVWTGWNDSKKCLQLNVSTVDLDAATTDSKLEFSAEPCIKLALDTYRWVTGHQSGGRVVQLDESTILLSVGDFEFEGVNRQPDLTQDQGSDFGKTIKIGLGTGQHKMFSIGHRNPQGLATLKNGTILLTEHGPQGGDELNVIEEGQNYGWPLVTLGVQYGGADWPRAKARGEHEGFRLPLYAWMPSIGISQLVQVDNFDPVWDGDVLVASLTNRTLYRLRIEENRIVYAEPIALNVRMRDIMQAADGRIILLTDALQIVVIESRQKTQADDLLAQAPEDVRQLLSHCLECHVLHANIDGSSSRIGFSGIVGRDVASWVGANYSDGLRSMTGAWDRARLDQYLANPGAVAADSPMATNAVRDPRIRQHLLDFLEKL